MRDGVPRNVGLGHGAPLAEDDHGLVDFTVKFMDPRHSEAGLISTSCRDLKIIALLNDRAGCGSYRAIHPLTILQRHGALVFFIDPLPPHLVQQGVERQIPTDIWEGANVIILQRTGDPRIIQMVGDRETRKRLGRTLIYESDDDIIHIDPKNPAAHRKGQAPSSGKHTPQLLRQIEWIVRECDGLFVSTPELAAQWCHLNRRTFVLPNSIDFSIRPAWSTPVPRQIGLPDKVVIGWAGGVHHVGDETPILGVIPDILRRFEKAHFGICSNPGIMSRWLEAFGLASVEVDHVRRTFHVSPLPEFVGRFDKIDPVPFDVYPAVIQQYDVGLAPLEANRFNLAKSELRLMEYAAVGVPYVASNWAPYARFHEASGGVGGYLASTKKEWIEAISRIVEDDAERKQRGAAIHEWVRKNANTDQIGLQWADAIRRVQQGAISTWEPRVAPGRNAPCPCQSGKRYKYCCRPAFG